MKNEPTVEQLEKLVEAFRKEGGGEAELALLAQDMLAEYLPGEEKSLKEIFSAEDHPDIVKIKEFKKSPKHPLRDAIETTWKKRKVRYPIIFAILFIIIFTILNLPLVIAKFKPVEPVKSYEKVKEIIRPIVAKSAPLESGEVIPNGDFLVVPKIEVNAPIVLAQSIDEKKIEADLKLGVVHYKDTALPGEAGNSFITGHSSNYWWDTGKYNYIFANLNRLAVGDQAKIYYQGNKFLYQAVEVKVVDPKDVSVLQPSAMPTLTLMTCTPPGTSWKRLIVRFNQVSPVYKAPVVVEKMQEVPNFDQLPSTNSNIFLDWIAKVFHF